MDGLLAPQWPDFTGLGHFASQDNAISDEAIRRIAQLYAVEKDARGKSSDDRVVLRQARAKPVFDDLEAWLHAQLPKISGKSPLA